VAPHTREVVTGRVDDAAALGEQVVTDVRAGVGIDRNTRSAAAGFRYEREVLPPGTRFTFRLVADEPRTGRDQAGDALAAAVGHAFEALTAALRAGQVPLGAARTRGLGAVRLEGAQIRSADLSRRAGLVAWLSGTTGWQQLTGPPPADAALAPGRLTVTIDWRPISPVLVKASLEGALIDLLPLTERGADGKVRLLLPGSSVKGVLRSHAERIVRTLQAQPAPGFLRETLDAEGLPAVAGLFGRSPQRFDAGGGRGQARDPGWRGALEIADCHSLGHVSDADWNAVLSAHPARPGQPAGAVPAAARPGAPQRDERRAGRQDAARTRRDERRALRARLDDLARPGDGLSLRIADHVAVDRWTGGAADSALFSVLEPMGAAWEPLRLRLDCRRAAGGTSDGDHLALALLLLVLRDLADGWLTFGFGTTRGEGQIAVSRIRFEGSALPQPWSALPEAKTLEAVLTDPPRDVLDAMEYWAVSLAAAGDAVPEEVAL
jgi:CRISPR/Cas system CSM-associated protein Csm3 (group 7 of RAMP superfamily)